MGKLAAIKAAGAASWANCYQPKALKKGNRLFLVAQKSVRI